jgi:hypothetical protein
MSAARKPATSITPPRIDGDGVKLGELLGLLEDPAPNFAIVVTPYLPQRLSLAPARHPKVAARISLQL